MNPKNRTNARKGWPDGLKKHVRSSGVYYYWVDPRSGTEKSLKCKDDFQTAKKRAAELNNIVSKIMADDIVNSIAYERKSNAPTLQDFLPTYLDYCKEAGQAKNTILTKTSHLNGAVDFFGDKALDEITVKDVNSMLKSYVDDGKKWKAKHTRTYLIDLYKHAKTTGDVSLDFNDPVTPTRAPKPKVKRARLMFEQFELIVAEAKKLKRKPWAYNSILLGLVTGQREADLTRTRFKKLKDWDGMYKKWVESDYHEDFIPYSYVGKNHLYMVQSKRNAMVKIPLALRLDAIGLTVGDVVKMCRDRVASRFLLHHTVNTAKAFRGDNITPVTISKNFKDCRNAAKLDESKWTGKTPPTYHELRSLSERLYEAQGINTQELLGHESPNSTAVYHDLRSIEWTEIKL